jgi:hypothetical protein
LSPARRHVAHAPTSSAVGSGSAVAPTHTPSWMTQPLTRPAQGDELEAWRCAWTTPAVAPAQCCSGRPHQLIPSTRISHMLDPHARTCGAGCCAAPRHVTHVSRVPSGQGPLWEGFISSSAHDSTCVLGCSGAAPWMPQHLHEHGAATGINQIHTPTPRPVHAPTHAVMARPFHMVLGGCAAPRQWHAHVRSVGSGSAVARPQQPLTRTALVNCPLPRRPGCLSHLLAPPRCCGSQSIT